MAQRGIKSTMLTNVPPDLRAKVDADIVTLLEHPGKADDGRPRNLEDVWRWHDLESRGVSIHALTRYARTVEAAHKLSLRANLAKAIADAGTDVMPANRQMLAALILDRLSDGDADNMLDVDDLHSLTSAFVGLRRVELKESDQRRKELDGMLARLGSNDSIAAFIAACEDVFGATWTERREEVLAAMQRRLTG